MDMAGTEGMAVVAMGVAGMVAVAMVAAVIDLA
jgi:hypothetical protein